MNHTRFYSFGWIPVAALLFAVLQACPSTYGAVMFWAFIVQLIGYYTIGAGLQSPAYLAAQAQAVSRHLVFDSVHFLCGVAPPTQPRASSSVWLERHYREKLLRMCDYYDQISRYVTEALNWVTPLVGSTALGALAYWVFNLSHWNRDQFPDVFQALVVLLICLVNYAWAVMVREGMLCAMTKQAQILRAAVLELERLYEFTVAVSAMPVSSEDLPRVVTNSWDKITGARERKHRAVEVVRRLLEHNCQVRVKELFAVLEKSGHFPKMHDALGANQLRKLFSGCHESWTIGARTPTGAPWRFCNQAALSNGSLKPVIWG